MGVYQAGLHLIEAGIVRIDVLLLDLYLIVVFAPGPVVGLRPWLRLCPRRSLRTRCGWRSLLLRLVLLYLRQAPDDIALLLLLLILQHEQLLQR